MQNFVQIVPLWSPKWKRTLYKMNCDEPSWDWFDNTTPAIGHYREHRRIFGERCTQNYYSYKSSVNQQLFRSIHLSEKEIRIWKIVAFVRNFCSKNSVLRTRKPSPWTLGSLSRFFMNCTTRRSTKMSITSFLTVFGMHSWRIGSRVSSIIIILIYGWIFDPTSPSFMYVLHRSCLVDREPWLGFFEQELWLPIHFQFIIAIPQSVLGVTWTCISSLTNPMYNQLTADPRW